MAEYRISGVWKNDNVITHYAVHKKSENSWYRSTKMTKAEAIKLVDDSSNTVYTWQWNYKTTTWSTGEKVTVVNGANGKYLRSNPDDSDTDNLGHLINYDWI